MGAEESIAACSYLLRRMSTGRRPRGWASLRYRSHQLRLGVNKRLHPAQITVESKYESIDPGCVRHRPPPTPLRPISLLAPATPALRRGYPGASPGEAGRWVPERVGMGWASRLPRRGAPASAPLRSPAHKWLCSSPGSERQHQ